MCAELSSHERFPIATAGCCRTAREEARIMPDRAGHRGRLNAVRELTALKRYAQRLTARKDSQVRH